MNRVVFPCAGALQQLAGGLAGCDVCWNSIVFFKSDINMRPCNSGWSSCAKSERTESGREGGSQRETLSEMYLCVPGP